MVSHKGGGDGRGVEDDEIFHVAAHDGGIHPHDRIIAPVAAIGHDRQAADEERQRTQHERGADDGAYADLMPGLFGAEQDGDDRHQGFRQGGADRGEDASHRSIGQIQFFAEPFQPVREYRRTQENDPQGQNQQQPVNHSYISTRVTTPCSLAGGIR